MSSPPTLPTSRQLVTQLLTSLPATLPLPEHAAADSNLLSGVPDAAKKQLLTLQVLFPNEFVPALDLLDRRLVTRFRICDSSQLNAPEIAAQREGSASEHGQLQDSEEAVQAGGTRLSHGSIDTNSSMNEPLHSHAAKVHTSSNIPTDDQVMPNVPQPAAPATVQNSTPSEKATVYYVRSAQQRSSRYSTSYDSTTSYEVRLPAWNCSCPAFAFSAFPAIHSEPPNPTYDDTGGGVSNERQATGWIFGGISLGDDIPPVCKHILACVLVEKCGGIFGGLVEERDVGVEEAAGWAAGWGD
ncbi:hypothetical protein BDW02DRAFT_326991 [Decorospora gaudefroyi]|uniref:SWIM-type domain-containing protein n=1 Tax=Decorospora gaudefroyi TaxID=184978 RepID=A0A6A5KFE5_9PLEO|nr:hypothetical protein BDW02DRAFT_326991 [Decorospora gaudefroyi]